jgi:hypothetical protein
LLNSVKTLNDPLHRNVLTMNSCHAPLDGLKAVLAYNSVVLTTNSCHAPMNGLKAPRTATEAVWPQQYDLYVAGFWVVTGISNREGRTR